MTIKISFNHETLKQVCKRHKIRRLAFFGSVVRSDFGPNSDVDVLIDFHPQYTPSLLDLGELQTELTQLFGRSVDILTYSSLKNPYRRTAILKDEMVQYDEAG